MIKKFAEYNVCSHTCKQFSNLREKGWRKTPECGWKRNKCFTQVTKADDCQGLGVGDTHSAF